MENKTKIAIIGAGVAGLVAGKCCLDANLDFDILEQSGYAGGTWNYCDGTLDKDGLPVHGSMYKNLKTNLPKEAMLMEGLTYPEELNESYIKHEEVLKYVLSYKEKFKLDAYIKYYKCVTKVIPVEDGLRIEYEDLLSHESDSVNYSHVMLCSGHFENYTIPEVSGIESFPGKVIHSHHYRKPDDHKDKRVLMVGAGPSGTGISEDLVYVAKKVYVSFSNEGFPGSKLHPQVIIKPKIKEIRDNVVYFTDTSCEEIDEILFCTGYDYTYPFLTPECGIEIKGRKYVWPLYKQIINIRNSNMAFIGLPFSTCPFPLFGIQVRFFLASVTGKFRLPSQEEMFMELKREEEEKYRNGVSLRHFHRLDKAMEKYLEDLSVTANIERLPPVIYKLYLRIKMNRDLSNCFKILDDNTFVQIA